MLHGIAAAQIFASGSVERGALVLSNFRSEQTPEVVVAAPLEMSPASESTRPTLLQATKFRQNLEQASKRASLPVELLDAIVRVESNYDPAAVSRKGALGLMQLMPQTARRFGVVDPFDVDQNLAGGAGYLGWLMQLFDRDLTLVLAAYNAGEQAVIRAGRKVPPYPETQAYVKRVLAGIDPRTVAALERRPASEVTPSAPSSPSPRMALRE